MFLAAQLDICRYKSKEVVRLLNKLKKEDINIDEKSFHLQTYWQIYFI